MEDHYKSVLVVNDTSEKVLTLYIYLYYDSLCWLSWSSKIIPVGDKYLYRSEDRFKFSLMATDAKKKKRTVLPVQKWKSDKLFVVSDSLEIKESNLADFPQAKQNCLRILNKDQEIAEGNCINFYELLKLNINDVRKKTTEEQNELIKKAFRQEIRRWHPDQCNIEGDDGQIAREYIAAYDVLRDPEKRATYHNLIDYDSGWKGKLKAIFWPECYTDEQKKNYHRRMKQFALSLGFVVGGIALSVGTAGLASPLFVVGGAVGGGSLICGGIQGAQRVMKRSSVKDGSWKNYFKSVGIGPAAGAAIGGIGAGVAAGFVGIGAASLQTANVSVAQYIAMGASTGAAGGVVASLSNDADKRLVDGEDVSLKQVVGHALLGAAVGGVAGIPGGTVTKAVEAGGTAAAAGNLKGDVAEQVFIRTGARRLGLAVARNVSKAVTESGTGTAIGSAGRFLEERLDDSMENRPLAAHVKNATTNVVTDVIVDGGKSCVSSLASHASTDIGQKIKQSFKSSSAKQNNVFNQDIAYDEKDKSQSPEEMDQPRKSKWNDFHSSEKYNPSVEKKLSKRNSSDLLFRFYVSPGDLKPQKGRIRYISEGDWYSKMIVKYQIQEVTVNIEVSGSGKSVEIPADAKSISVRFQVDRLIWCDVKKYDRINRKWIEPITPHIFQYDRPPIRTFTLSGSLYYEAVMKIINENYDELSEM